MAIPDPNKIWPKLEAIGEDEVRKKLAAGLFASFKKPVIEEWLARMDTPTYMYHEFDAPAGRFFRAGEVKKLGQSGWVDTPAKFGTGIRSRARRTWIVILAFLKREWKWVVGTLIAIAVLLVKYSA